MTDELDTTATPTADPDVEGNTGSDTVVPSDTASDGAGTPRTMPDEAYKGIQRRLDREQRERARLEAQIQELRNGAATPGQPDMSLVMPLLNRLKELNPEAAQAEAIRIREQMREAELQGYRTADERRRHEEEASRVEAANVAQLRSIAQDMGADPDSPLVDYGDGTMFLHERIELVRTTAKEAAAPATPVTPAPTAPTAGRTHNLQPGTPPTPRGEQPVPTKAEYDTALLDYSRSPNAAKLAKLTDMRNARMQAAGNGTLQV